MKKLVCVDCGAVHHSNIDHDECGSCGGAMLPADPRIEELLSVDRYQDAVDHLPDLRPARQVPYRRDAAALDAAERELMEWAAIEGLSRSEAIRSLHEEIAAGNVGVDEYRGFGDEAVPPHRYDDLIRHMMKPRPAPISRRVLPTAPVNDNVAPRPGDRSVRSIVVFGAVLMVAIFAGASAFSASGMEACQRLHSFETCFSTLNR